MTYHLVTVVVIVSTAMIISRLVEVGQREAAPLGRILLYIHDAAVARGAASSDHQQASVRDSNTTALTATFNIIYYSKTFLSPMCVVND